mgnify:CR=1 FL=1
MDLSAKAAKIRKGPKRKSKLHNYYTTGDRFLLAFFTLVLVFAFIAVLYPLIYALISSFNKGMLPLSLIPNRITLAGYEVCLQYGYLWKGFLNSVIYMIVGTALALLVTICCAYPMSLPLRLGGVMAVICMFTMYFDGGLVPTYLWMKQLGLYNTMWALVLPASLSVYNMLVMRSYFTTAIPGDLREAAELDGAGEMTYLMRIVLPLSLSVIAVVALYYASALWSSYFQASIYIKDREKLPLANVLRTILVGAESYGSEGGVDSMTAEKMEERRDVMKYCVMVLATVPMMLIYPFIQKYFVSGVMIGAVKG